MIFGIVFAVPAREEARVEALRCQACIRTTTRSATNIEPTSNRFLFSEKIVWCAENDWFYIVFRLLATLTGADHVIHHPNGTARIPGLSVMKAIITCLSLIESKSITYTTNVVKGSHKHRSLHLKFCIDFLKLLDFFSFSLHITWIFLLSRLSNFVGVLIWSLDFLNYFTELLFDDLRFWQTYTTTLYYTTNPPGLKCFLIYFSMI